MDSLSAISNRERAMAESGCRLGVVAGALVILTILFYLMSVTSEGLVVACFFRDLPRTKMRRWMLQANAITYAVLIGLVLTGTALPRFSHGLFRATEPVTDFLIDTAGSLVSRFSNEERESALMEAVEADNVERVRKLIGKGTTVNEEDKNGFTPLQSAAASGNDKIVKLLLDAGADVNARPKSGINRNALDDAAYTGMARRFSFSSPTVLGLTNLQTRVGHL